MISTEKLTFKIGNKTVELTEDEARKLSVELDGLFGTAPAYPNFPIMPFNPWPNGPITYMTNSDSTEY